jgi:uncharacterized membrane protein
MRRPSETPDRLAAFSDGVFAIVITILVLELHPPSEPSFAALARLWPVGLSYAVSYLFLAIVWTNHHHLIRFTDVATPRLIWSNFGHLFSVSFLPFTTSWIASSRMAAVPVAFYAVDFFLVNATYLLLCFEAVDRPNNPHVPHADRRVMRIRSLTTLGLFAFASIIALYSPVIGLGTILACLLLYLRPDAWTFGWLRRVE